jgi:transcriptional regulator with XRE-family HTH domain
MLRVFRGVSQKQLAKEIGKHHMSISGYERGRMKIRGSHLERMLPALKISRRAWEATLLHVTWLNQLDDAEASVREGEPGSLAGVSVESCVREVRKVAYPESGSRRWIRPTHWEDTPWRRVP